MAAILHPFISLFCLLLLAGCARPAPPRLVTAAIAGAERWHGTVQVAGDIVVAAGASLTIEPGTVVQFLPPGPAELYTEHPHFTGSELIVRGTLTASGTPTAPIRFEAADPAAAAGSWGGINLQDGAVATFRFCSFRQADSAIHSQESTVAIEESLFAQNLVAVRFHSSDLRLEHSLLRDNGTAIRFHFGAPVIRENVISNNLKGFFVTADPQDYLITRNTIADNVEMNVVLGEDVPDDLVLAGNYWGAVDAQRIEESFFDGRRVDYLGRVRFLPLLDEAPLKVGPSWSR